MPMRRFWSQILKEPYRLFFPLGVVLGLAGTGHWVFYGTGLTAEYSGYYHSSLQTWLYMGAFIAGFLMTAIPRFASAAHATTGEVARLLILMIFIFFMLALKAWVPAGAGYLLWLLSLLFFIVKRFRSKGHTAQPPMEFVWMPFAFLNALAGTAVVTAVYAGAAPSAWMSAARSAAEQGFILCLVLGVGGFLGPRLLGLHQMPDPADLQKAGERMRRRFICHLALAALLTASFLVETRHQPAAYWLRAFVVTLDLAAVSKVLARPKVRSLFHVLFSSSFWMVVAGVWASAAFPVHRVNMLHLVFLGGFSYMTFLVATMVTLSHSGAGDQLRKPLWIFWVIPAGVMGSLLVRVTAHLAPQSYFLHLGAAAALWMATGAAWLVFAAPHLLRIPEENVFERDHERFKRESASRETC